MVKNKIRLSFIAAFLLCLSIPIKIDKNTKNSIENNLTNAVLNSMELSNVDIKILNSETQFTSSVKSFSIKTSESIDKILGNGTPVIKSYSKIEDNNYNIEIQDITDLSKIKLEFYKHDELVKSLNLYFAKDKNNIFYSSSISIDTAKRYAKQELNYYLESINKTYNKTYTKNSIGVVGSVSGELKREDSEGNIFPLIGAKVKVTINGTWWNKETYTNQSGFYYIDYNDIWYLGSGRPSIHIYSENNLIKVHNGGIYVYSYEFEESSGDLVYSYTFSPKENRDSDMGKAISIFQAGINFAKYANYLNGNKDIDLCNIRYPSDVDNFCYEPSSKTIYIPNLEIKLVESYTQWDIIGHEYGHHFMYYFNVSNNPGGEHVADTNLIDYLYENTNCSLFNAKENGLKLAWNEAFPTYWSIVAQRSFSNDLKTIKYVGDTIYTNYYKNYNLDIKFSTSKGDADEIAISRLLYKLYSEDLNNDDKFALGDVRIWNIILKYKPNYLYEFIEGLYKEGFDKNNISYLLDEYNIISNFIMISNNYIDSIPYFTWFTDSGSKYLKYNEFDLYIETMNNELIHKYEKIYSNKSKCELILDEEVWTDICNTDSNFFKIYFVARQNNSFASGNYYSEKFIFEKPNLFKNKVQIKPSDWGFNNRYYFQNEIDNNEHRYTTYFADYFEIKTDRLRCGYIEDLYINLSPRRINAGYSYFELNFNVPVYSFMYSVCLWSNNESLDGSAKLLYKNNKGNWIELVDLLSDIVLTTKEEGIKRYSFYMNDPIYGLKFETTSSAIGSRNKGRLCIDDIVLSINQGIDNNKYYYKYYNSLK